LRLTYPHHHRYHYYHCHQAVIVVAVVVVVVAVGEALEGIVRGQEGEIQRRHSANYIFFLSSCVY
jgi:hypothetical protein